MTSREITVGDVPCIASRVTYVGELGWELYCPAEYGATLWDTLCVDGVTPGGYRAIESLRLEKGYRAWASDLTAETTPLEAGLGFAVKMRQGRLHRARRARRAEAEARVHRARRSARGRARLGAGAGGRRDRRPCDERRLRLRRPREHRRSRTSPCEHSAPGTQVAVDIFGDWVEGEVRAEPLYDPKGERVRA